MTILVTGATGNVGRHIVQQLLDAGETVRALTRDPDAARLPAEVEIVAGDLTRTASLEPALRGVKSVHLINFGHDYAPLTNGPGIVEALRRNGIGKVTMLHGWDVGSLERAVMGSDLEWTWVAGGEYMSNALDWAESIRTKRQVRAPFVDGHSPMSHEADIAAVVVTALCGDGHHAETYHVAGPTPVSVRDKVRHLAEAIGEDIELVEQTEAEAREEMAAQGSPPEMAEFLVEVFGSLPTEPYAMEGSITVRRLTGQEPRDFAQWARENAAAFE